jgi:hypothetical protein
VEKWRPKPAYIIERDIPADEPTHFHRTIGIIVLCGIVGSAAWLVARPQQASRIVSSLGSGSNTRQPASTYAAPKSVVPAAVERVKASSRQTKSTRDDRAIQPIAPLAAALPRPEARTVGARSVVAKPASAPDNVLERATAEYLEARALFEREDYAAASAGFARVVGMLEREPALGSDLNRVAAEFAAISRERAAREAARLFSESDLNVAAPVAVVASSLPPPPVTGTPTSRLDVLELVIDATGAVEKARFITSKNHYRNLWWVSAAKTWRFQPAMKDGHPVRFVTHIQIDDGESP